MRTIYLVTEGEYSDYHVLTAFEWREDAEQFVAEYGALARHSDSPEIEEYDLHGESERPHRVDYLLMEGRVRGGEVSDVSERPHAAWSYSYDIPSEIPDGRATVTVGRHRHGEDFVTVTGRDHEQVRKAFRDRVAKIRAEQLEPKPSR